MQALSWDLCGKLGAPHSTTALSLLTRGGTGTGLQGKARWEQICCFVCNSSCSKGLYLDVLDVSYHACDRSSVVQDNFPNLSADNNSSWKCIEVDSTRSSAVSCNTNLNQAPIFTFTTLTNDCGPPSSYKSWYASGHSETTWEPLRLTCKHLAHTNLVINTDKKGPQLDCNSYVADVWSNTSDQSRIILTNMLVTGHTCWLPKIRRT